MQPDVFVNLNTSIAALEVAKLCGEPLFTGRCVQSLFIGYWSESMHLRQSECDMAVREDLEDSVVK